MDVNKILAIVSLMKTFEGMNKKFAESLKNLPEVEDISIESAMQKITSLDNMSDNHPMIRMAIVIKAVMSFLVSRNKEACIFSVNLEGLNDPDLDLENIHDCIKLIDSGLSSKLVNFRTIKSAHQMTDPGSFVVLVDETTKRFTISSADKETSDKVNGLEDANHRVEVSKFPKKRKPIEFDEENIEDSLNKINLNEELDLGSLGVFCLN